MSSRGTRRTCRTADSAHATSLETDISLQSTQVMAISPPALPCRAVCVRCTLRGNTAKLTTSRPRRASQRRHANVKTASQIAPVIRIHRGLRRRPAPRELPTGVPFDRWSAGKPSRWVRERKWGYNKKSSGITALSPRRMGLEDKGLDQTDRRRLTVRSAWPTALAATPSEARLASGAS